MDSQVDTVFWICAAICIWLVLPEVITANKFLVIALLSMEAFCYLLSYWRFGKDVNCHAWLSKLWGITLLISCIAIFGFGYGGVLFKVCAITGLVSQLDRVLIILILPGWTHDIPSTYHAWLISKGIEFKKYKLLNS